VRYTILSKRLSARKFADAVRGHWSIENRLHWQLDVTFGDGVGYGAQGVGFLRGKLSVPESIPKGLA